MTSPLPAAVFKWSTPLVVPGPTPWPVAPLYRVTDLRPLRAWLDGHGYGDVVLSRIDNRTRSAAINSAPWPTFYGSPACTSTNTKSRASSDSGSWTPCRTGRASRSRPAPNFRAARVPGHVEECLARRLDGIRAPCDVFMSGGDGR